VRKIPVVGTAHRSRPRLLLIATGDSRCRTGTQCPLGALDGALELWHFPGALELSQRLVRRTDTPPFGFERT
jgi:hypothetical protein